MNMKKLKWIPWASLFVALVALAALVSSFFVTDVKTSTQIMLIIQLITFSAFSIYWFKFIYGKRK